MADVLFLYSVEISIRLSGVSGLSLFECNIFFYHTFGELLKRYCTIFCRLFAFKLKLKPGTALNLSSRRFCRVNGNVITE